MIRKTPYGEADFLVRVLARNFGKIDVIARGARKSISKLNAHIDTLNFIRFSFVKNGDRLCILTDAEIIDRFGGWFMTSEKTAFAGRIARTIDIVAAQDQEDDALLDYVLAFLNGEISFDAQKDGMLFLCEVFVREGYGQVLDLKVLPNELLDAIMKLWPALMN